MERRRPLLAAALGLALLLVDIQPLASQCSLSGARPCPAQLPVETIHADVQSICCIGQDCSSAEGLPSVCRSAPPSPSHCLGPFFLRLFSAGR